MRVTDFRLMCLCVLVSLGCIGLMARDTSTSPAWTRTIATPAPVEDWDVLDAIDKQAKQLRAEVLKHLEENREHGLISIEMKASEGRKPEKKQ